MARVSSKGSAGEAERETDSSVDATADALASQWNPDAANSWWAQAGRDRLAAGLAQLEQPPCAA